jgi:hypothetical protein
VALRPRFSPGVPFSRDCGVTLQQGTMAVKMLVVQRLTPSLRARDLPRFRVKSARFANTPRGPNHVDQRHDVSLLHRPARFDDPHSKTFLALAGERQHVAGDVYDREGRFHRPFARDLAAHS